MQKGKKKSVCGRLEKAEDVYGPKDTQPAGMQRSVLFSDDEDEDTEPPKLSDAALRRKELQERQRMHKEETQKQSKN